LGGIIADEMGLGKSLTMLSAIVGSLENARHFAQSGSRDMRLERQQKVAAKATLVIAPSVCELDISAMRRCRQTNNWLQYCWTDGSTKFASMLCLPSFMLRVTLTSGADICSQIA